MTQKPAILDEVVHCGICGGKGEYEQTYTAGCGMGYYRSFGNCDFCNGHGLRYKDSYNPVPASVVTQYKNALAEWEKVA